MNVLAILILGSWEFRVRGEGLATPGEYVKFLEGVETLDVAGGILIQIQGLEVWHGSHVECD